MLLKYQLDMEQASLSDEGLSEYLWPYPLDHMLPFRNNFTENLVTETRAMCGSNIEGSTGLLILLHHLFLDALRLFYCVRIVEGFSSLGRRVAPPPRAYTLSAIAEGKIPPFPEIYRSLLNGPPRPKRWRAPFRLARDYFVTEEITRRRMRGPDYKSEIVAATISPLTEEHAKSINERVTFRRPHVWFNEPPKGVDSGDTPRCVDTVLDILKTAFLHSGTAPPGWLDDYVWGWLGPGIAQVEAYLHNIESAPEYIPRHLWVGTGGDIWTRILRYATRRNHGHVTAHDHGCGSGQFQGEFHMNIIEFESCDRFMTFTEAQADGLRQHHLNSHFLIRDDAPVIANVMHQRHPNRHRTRAAGDPKTIMVVSNFYLGDHIVPSACISDVAYCDFEARLLAHLRDWGHKIIYKPRPLIGTRAPADFAARFDGREENRPSETVLHNADVLILPSPTSTSFATALASKVPSVFIDFGMITHSNNARAALEKCCAIVPAPHGPNNRIVINWDLLQQAITKAPSLDDDTYVSLFHGRMV